MGRLFSDRTNFIWNLVLPGYTYRALLLVIEGVKIMIEKITKLIRKPKKEVIENAPILDLGSAVKETTQRKKTESPAVEYFKDKKPAYTKPFVDDEVKVRSFLTDDPEFPPLGSYQNYPAVMFESTFWIKRDFLVPIGRSRITGYTIYRYVGKDPQKDLNSIGIDWGELH